MFKILKFHFNKKARIKILMLNRLVSIINISNNFNYKIFIKKLIFIRPNLFFINYIYLLNFYCKKYTRGNKYILYGNYYQ